MRVRSALKMITVMLAAAMVFAGCKQINDVFGSDTSGGGDSGQESENDSDDTTAPAEVTDLSASPADGEVGLSWSDPGANDLTRIAITWEANDGPDQPITVDPGVESATVTGLSNGSEYTFTVTAVDNAGNGSAGATVSVTPMPPPDAPGNLQATVVSDTQIDLSWTDNAAAEEGFEVERNGSVVASDVSADRESYGDTGLSANTGYTYRVRATNAAGASAWTSERSATTASPGSAKTHAAGGVSFDMHFVPPKSFPTGTGDSGSSSVSDAYWIAKTEVTYELWYVVRNWAESNGYSFANAGREGNDGSDGPAPTTADQEPVTHVNWRDAMAWTNALTEWYNAQTGESLEPVYHEDISFDHPIRSVDDTETVDYPNQGSQDHPYVKSEADGFRLPTSDEWELAARFIEDANGDGDIEDAGESYPGNYASGADANYGSSSVSQDLDGDGDQDITDDVAWHSGNSGSETHPVAQKNANALGLNDLTGSVWEWNFDWYPGNEGALRVYRGGSWTDSELFLLQVGIVNNFRPYRESYDIGFRPARNAQ